MEMHGVWDPNLLSYSFSAHSFHGLETWLLFAYFFSKQLTFNKGNTSVRSPEQCLFHSKDACHCFPNVVFWKPGGSRCISEPSFLRSSQAWRWISWQAGNVSGSWHLRNHHTRSDPAQIILVLWAKCVESSATGDDSQAQSSNQGQHQEPMVF